jgi:rod shape-determining protein MreC
MARALSERRPLLLFVSLLALNLMLMSSRVRGARSASVLEEAVLTVASPVFKTAAWVSSGVTGLWKAYVDLRGVEETNRRLQAAIGALELRASRAEEARSEVERLQALLELRAQIEHPTIAARVIARGAGGATMTLLLDRGAEAGVRPEDPVITSRGVVGRVIEAAPGIAKVQTIIDPNSGVAALIQRTRVQGAVVGEGDGSCRMEFVSALASVEVGDVVVTSGLDQIYPKGYIVGIVTSVGAGEGLTKRVEVRPEVNFLRLEEILVIVRSGDAVIRGPR